VLCSFIIAHKVSTAKLVNHQSGLNDERQSKLTEDVKVYLYMCNFGDAVKLQDALDLLITDWAKEWQLSLSVNKCNILSIRKCPDNALYYINGIELPCLSQYRDLGVVITSELSPSLHTQHITATAHQRANSILRCFVSGDVK